jgi:5-hydroxyisourate hydrolase-like protein (transthyretin family)
MQRALIIALISAPILAFCGCDGEKTPPDMPKLQPTLITIVQEGTPVEGASVQLQKKDDLAYKWFAGGVTDAQGVCVIRTLGKYNGAPEGDFQVVVYKTTRTESETRKNQPSPPQDPEGAQEWVKKVSAEEKEYEEIDPKYKKVELTDLAITIVPGKNAQTFDVGAKVRIENKQMLTK